MPLDLKSTINLPKTDFPMKANLPQNEPKALARWEQMGIYERIRQARRLNSQMVLLTIAISGGPFVGLLGTVMGVMITFASVAAAGDVNVNAIAPGIAAALLATVAGLAVAIPSLFGYNWLSAQIQDIRDGMDIFVDELVARIANIGASGESVP